MVSTDLVQSTNFRSRYRIQYFREVPPIDLKQELTLRQWFVVSIDNLIIATRSQGLKAHQSRTPAYPGLHPTEVGIT